MAFTADHRWTNNRDRESCLSPSHLPACGAPSGESGRIPVSGRVVGLTINLCTERWIPSPECILPLLVEYAGSDLKQKMSSALSPRHLLAFYHPLADDLIDC